MNRLIKYRSVFYYNASASENKQLFVEREFNNHHTAANLHHIFVSPIHTHPYASSLHQTHTFTHWSLFSFRIERNKINKNGGNEKYKMLYMHSIIC